MYGLIAVQELAGTGLFEQVAQRGHVGQLLFVFGGTLAEFVEVDSNHGGVAAVVDHRVFAQGFEVIVNLPKLGHGCMVGADRRLALDGHPHDLALCGGDLGVTQFQYQANAVQKREHLRVVFADAFHADVAAQVIAATGAIALVTGIGRAAGEAMGVQTAQLRFVFGHIRRIVARRTGPQPRVGNFPWWLLKMAAPFIVTFRELQEMRYLWQTPLLLNNHRLLQTLGNEPHTPLDEAVEATLVGMGNLPLLHDPAQNGTNRLKAPTTR